MRRAGPVRAQPVRVLRGLWPDHNPLRRTTDRVEAAILAAVIVLFLVAAPLAGLVATRWAAANIRHTERLQANWRRVPAVLLTQAPAAVLTMSQASADPLVPARWRAPGGGTRTGKVYARPGAPAGSTVLVWIDGAGQQVGSPLQPAEAAGQTALAALFAVVLLAMGFGSSGVATRKVIHRRRIKAWDLSWAVTGPQWTGHR
jgi:hypothetical protein